ncbi:MAG: UDP-N-acetylmuramoyl-tripeptide--D-alanyl-D-alanine ligase [Enterobacteriaceae bacterium]|jgi:UDP-N-acetylmuramoyl-tripeptide--D-alanyl-D-alanine ligase|nr:UDP-N-acetylmuramoyl-tripeptide--D-alanyl-D-alanine ligase [Enterobacteriaceae bacterium]
MIPLTLEQLAQITKGTLYLTERTLQRVSEQQAASIQIQAVETDSRKITNDTLFIALKGENFDAHDFAADVAEKGAVALLVSRALEVDCPQVIVKDTRLALGKLAGWVRQQSHARVVALTGSSGKTSVKEMTAAVLRQCGNTLYTAGNFNNDIGVPLTLFRLTPEHQFAVIELGANHIGEIAYTTDIVRPDSALVNNLFSAHLEGFGSLAGVAKAKGEIFAGLSPAGTAVINLDSNDWHHWQQDISEQQTVWRFSASGSSTSTAEADFYATDIQAQPLETTFCLHTPIGHCEITLPLPGKHNIANVLAASALAISVGASLENIRAGLLELKAVPGRLFPVYLTESKVILDDTYNANPGSMIAAAHVLSQMPGYRVMVVSDMAELGDAAVACHRQVGEAIASTHIEQLLSVGPLSAHISEASGRGQHFTGKTELVAALLPLLKEHKIISVLIKGSRSAAMEEVVGLLKENFQC